MNIDQAWNLLQKNIQNGAKESVVSRIDWKHKDCDLWLGLSLSAQPFLAIEASNTAFEKNLDLQKFVSFDLDIVERFSKKFIEIKLSKNSFKDHFLTFIKDLVSYAEGCEVENRISEYIVDRIESWDMFFARERNSVLSLAELLGLWGELEFLKELLKLSNKNQRDVINSWQLSSGLDKDFRFKKSSIEIKTSMLRKKTKFTISSEIQLENHSENPLYLIGYVLSPDAQDRLTINALVDLCRSYIKNAKDVAEFDLKILKRGFLESDKKSYETIILGVGKKYHFFVSKTFPCLTRSLLSNSISNVSYEIDPELCMEFTVDLGDIINGIN